MGESQKYFDWFCSPDSLQGSGCIFFEILLIWGLDVTAYGNIQYLIKKNMIWFFEMQSCHLASCKSTSGFRVPRGASFLQITSACGRINLILFFHLYMQMTNIDQNDQKLAPRSLHRHTRLNRWSPPPTSPSWSIIKTFLAKLWSVSPLSEHRPWLKRSCYHRPQGRLHFHDHNSGFIFSSATIVVTRGKKDKDQRWNKREKGNFLLFFLLLPLPLLFLHSHQIQSVKS